ncbi:MAG: DUF3784 domain-containing protein [Blautia sp.]|nr:DUF3784 domain-containing protein [Blautia sp.]
MSKEFDYIIAAIAIVCGLLLLTGNGGFLMKGGNEMERNKKYDQKKMERACGIAAVILGLATLADSFANNLIFTFGYMGLLVVVLGWLFWYIRNKCRKD